LPSSRERDVLSLVGRGLSNKQIADELGFSEPAVKAALQRLFRKFGVGSRAQLVAVSTELTRRTG
jgi:two-component system nitrate/nitrite response regulator NarL